MKTIDSIGGVSALVDLLRMLMMWGVVDALLLRKEMTVSNGWVGQSWDFCGGLLVLSPSRVGLRKLHLSLLLVLLDGGL